MKNNFFFFFMLKSVLKCIESIRIKKKMGLNFFKIPRANLGGGGRWDPAMLVKRQLFEFEEKNKCDNNISVAFQRKSFHEWLS